MARVYKNRWVRAFAAGAVIFVVFAIAGVAFHIHVPWWLGALIGGTVGFVAGRIGSQLERTANWRQLPDRDAAE